MMPVAPALFTAMTVFAAAPTPAPIGDVAMQVELRHDHVVFSIKVPGQEFVGAVLASLSPELRLYSDVLPPLLDDFVLVGAGLGAGAEGYQLAVPRRIFPAGQTVYLQGVAWAAGSLDVTEVDELLGDQLPRGDE